jgi:hypothetical protein
LSVSIVVCDQLSMFGGMVHYTHTLNTSTFCFICVLKRIYKGCEPPASRLHILYVAPTTIKHFWEPSDVRPAA